MKKTVSIIMALVIMTAAVMLTSCDGKPAESDTVTTAAETKEITVPEATLHYVNADIYADKTTAEANGLKVADNASISGWFKEKVEFDENFEIKLPDEFNNISSYVLRIAQGQYIEEVTVLKASDASAVEAVKALAEYRLNKQKSNNDFKLYDDEKGTNAKMIDTGKVVVSGNFVVYAVTENTEVSVARAQKFAQEHPDASAYELYKAIVTEE